MLCAVSMHEVSTCVQEYSETRAMLQHHLEVLLEDKPTKHAVRMYFTPKNLTLCLLESLDHSTAVWDQNFRCASCMHEEQYCVQHSNK